MVFRAERYGMGQIWPRAPVLHCDAPKETPQINAQQPVAETMMIMMMVVMVMVVMVMVMMVMVVMMMIDVYCCNDDDNADADADDADADDDVEVSRSDAWGVARSDALDVSRSETLSHTFILEYPHFPKTHHFFFTLALQCPIGLFKEPRAVITLQGSQHWTLRWKVLVFRYCLEIRGKPAIHRFGSGLSSFSRKLLV